MKRENSDGRILIVDDNTNNLAVLYNYLDKMGHAVLVSQDGETAVDLAAREQPDLILLDVLLPGINGFEVCRRLKATAETADIPVLFMSALSETEDKVEGFRAGAVDYITKPLQQEEVLARINAHLTIRHQRDELNRLNATKSRFFGVIAHDLRGPFMGLLGALELMRDSIESFDQETLQTMAASLHESAEKTYLLLNNLLEWARSQQNKVEFHPTELVLHQIAGEIALLFRATAGQKSIQITNTIPSEVTVHADRNMLATVLRNLMNNAVKFTPENGTVTICAETDGEQATVTIADTGVGIPEDLLPKLFELDRSTSRSGTAGESGSGLGLLLVRDYVERHGGTVWATSTPGQGSQFRFTIPLRGESPQEADASDQ